MTRKKLDAMLEDRRVFAHYSDAEKRLARLLKAALAALDAYEDGFRARGWTKAHGKLCDCILCAPQHQFDAALKKESA